MGLISKLLSPFLTGTFLMRPFLPAPIVSGPTLLADFDYRTPVASWKTGFTDFSSPVATDEWTIASTAYSGGYANNVGSESMVALAGGLTAQTAPDVYTATGYNTAGAFESTATSHKLTASGATAGEFNALTTDFCFRLVFRAPATLPNTEYVISKFSTVGGGGWRVYTSGADFIFNLFDNSSNSASVGFASPAKGDYDDSAVHYITGWWDSSTTTLFCKGDLSAEVSASGAAIVDSTATTAAMCLNGYDQSGTAGAAQLQVIYGGVCVGANAQAMYDEDFWQHAGDPNAGTAAALTTQTRASAISVPLSATHVGHFSDDTLPLGWHTALEAAAGGYGLYCNSAVTNLVPYSRLSTGATGATTNTDNAVDAPDGFRAAATHASTASPDYVGKTCVTVAATEYTGSVYRQEVTVGVAGRIYAYDLTNAAEIAASATAFTADADWTRISTPAFTTPAGCISVSIRVEITTTGQTVALDFWQLELGDGAGAIINTSGSSAALAACDYRGVGSADVLAKSAAGEFEAVFVARTSPGRYILDLTNGSSNVDRRSLLYATDASNLVQCFAYDGAGSYQGALNQAMARGTEDTAVMKWNPITALADGSNFSLKVDSETVLTDTATFSSGGAITTIQLGAPDTASGSNLDGFLSRVRIWDGERAA